MEKNPGFRLMVASGHNDTATTSGAAEYAVTQADWPRDRLWPTCCEGCDVPYPVEAAAWKLADDLRAFLRPAR